MLGVLRITYSFIDSFIFPSLFLSIKLSNLKIPTSSMKTGTNGLTISLSGASISGKADWHYKQKSWYVQYIKLYIILHRHIC